MRTRDHLQRDVSANDKAGVPDDRDRHRSSLAGTCRNVEHAMTLRYFSGGKQVWNS
jgi:hypothetical protein